MATIAERSCKHRHDDNTHHHVSRVSRLERWALVAGRHSIYPDQSGVIRL
ncbi:hypothetical protein NZK35_04430 [Stieleria sp. ICT_E10.1]|nr:hypothetical protein [Stieleria sedimenti]MCS7465917.1 hypothetical protein [Stieleria sedimenti]